MDRRAEHRPWHPKEPDMDPLPTPAAPAPAQPHAWRSWWRNWARPFLTVLATLLVFRALVLDWNVVPTGSMKPTIVAGDYILVNKLAYGLKLPFCSGALVAWSAPRRGDVIVFEPPGEQGKVRYVKRIVGLPGDKVQMHDNDLFINGRRARYPILL